MKTINPQTMTTLQNAFNSGQITQDQFIQFILHLTQDK
jgi:hypothetical protein